MVLELGGEPGPPGDAGSDRGTPKPKAKAKAKAKALAPSGSQLRPGKQCELCNAVDCYFYANQKQVHGV